MAYAKNDGFSVNPNRQPNGYAMKFDNGWRVSVQWGAGNYCANRDMDRLYLRTDRLTSSSAEVLVCHPAHRHDHVAGWLRPKDVAGILNFVASWKDSDPKNISRLKAHITQKMNAENLSRRSA